jgi:hypothetical protein
MGFSYKTSWLAVRDRSLENVADAVELVDRTRLGFAAGTERAYQAGIYVAPAIAGWTLAHGARHLSLHLDATDPRFPARFSALSARLGEVQFFATHRVPEYHAWAWARDGQLIRAYCYIGERGEVPLFVGEPTTAERDAAVGTRMLDGEWERWTDDEWDAWNRTTPNESDVMRMAGCWSVDPNTIDDIQVIGDGLYGSSTQLTLS